jgi:N6-adenosine-specific RNA methylase IME4
MGTGDTYRRVFTGDVAQCGCYWVRDAPEHVALGVHGDVLVECAFHQQVSQARHVHFERGCAARPR